MVDGRVEKTKKQFYPPKIFKNNDIIIFVCKKLEFIMASDCARVD